MGILFAETPQLTPARAPELNGNEAQVHAAIGEDEVHIDTIIERSSLPSHTVSSTLLSLEMKKLVRQLPGSRFVKTA
jgi:DNA processing protein